jgi:hypothetical protein
MPPRRPPAAGNTGRRGQFQRPEMGRLHDAAEKGDVAAVRRLIAEKCNVNEGDGVSRTTPGGEGREDGDPPALPLPPPTAAAHAPPTPFQPQQPRRAGRGRPTVPLPDASPHASPPHHALGPPPPLPAFCRRLAPLFPSPLLQPTHSSPTHNSPSCSRTFSHARPTSPPPFDPPTLSIHPPRAPCAPA